MTERTFERLRDEDARDARDMAYAITAYLHHSIGTPRCSDPTLCDLCSNAARLAVQWYRPRLERRIVESIQALYGVRCESHHMSSDD